MKQKQCKGFYVGVMLANTKIGAMGEFVAASVILGFEGWSVGHVPQDGFDLIAFDDIGAFKVQVKSGFLRVNSSSRSPHYHFNNGTGGKKKLQPEKYDILCHCSLSARRCIFYPSTSVRSISQRYQRGFFDDPHKEQESWENTIRYLREGFC